MMNAFVVLAVLLLSAPAFAANEANGNWTGRGFVEISTPAKTEKRESDSVGFSFEHSSRKLALKVCRFLFEDGAYLDCEPFAFDIKNRSELWIGSKKVGILAVDNFQADWKVGDRTISVSTGFTPTNLNYQYVSTVPNTKILRVAASLTKHQF